MRKRRKLEECSRVYRHENNGEVDIISNLPEHILHHIFTFLDMKHAVHTCILSKRWRHFWVSLPTLNFKYMSMDFVDRVLMFRGNSNIHEFIFVNRNYIVLTKKNLNSIDVTERLNTWILACVHRNVQKLTLTADFTNKFPFHFHHCLFTCKSLTELVVKASSGYVSISLPDSIALPRLKLLSLDSVTFEGGEKVTDHLFSSCPVLESLIMKNCEFPHDNINISSPQLQHLVLERCNCCISSSQYHAGRVDIKFNLCAPNLLSFYCDGSMLQDRAPNNLSSLVKAIIYVDVSSPRWSKEKKAMYAQCMMNILRELHNVEDLTLSASFLMVIRGAPDLLDSQPTKFGNLRCLKLESRWISVHYIVYIHGISYLLKIFPNVETLSLEDFDKVAMNRAPTSLEMQPPQFSNLRCLKMGTSLSRDHIYATAYFLKIFPRMETLSMKVSSFSSYSGNEWNPYWDEITSNSAKREDHWKAVLSLECLLNHLKCVELHGVMGCINELEFLEILLKNAMLLEKLIIMFPKFYSDDDKRRRIKFTEKVLTIPRVPSSVVILFN